MSSFLSRFRRSTGGIPYQSPTETRPGKTFPPVKPEPKDPNAPDRRLQLHQQCLYERQLPGNAFVSAHVNRLQHGFYESSELHEPDLDNIYFVSVHFVFHPHDPRSHRFRSAVIRVSVYGDIDPNSGAGNGWFEAPSCPRILRHAPELMYGAVSPENLQWNFSLSSSLGVSQTPLAATVNPAGGVRGSYRVYDMMSIQGSLRTLQSPLGPQYDVEDGTAVWTLQENLLQRSGLPREFDFVILVHKPDDVKNVYLNVDVDAEIETWFGAYPQWYMNLRQYHPYQDHNLDFNTDIGQKFLPTHPGRGFNFADLPHPLDEYVTMPGTTYPTNDTSRSDDRRDDRRSRNPKHFHHNTADTPTVPTIAKPTRSPVRSPTTPTRDRRPSQALPQNRHSWAPDNTLNVRVLLEHTSPQSSSSRRYSGYSGSPIETEEQVRHRSIRRSRPRSGLNEFSAQQALQEIARETLNGEPK